MSIKKIIFFAFSLLFVNLLNAQTFTWTGSQNNSWNDERNWDDGDGYDIGDGYPNSSSHTVIIADVSTNPIINDAGLICGALTIQSSGLLTSNNGSNDLTATTIEIQSGGQLSITNGEVQSGNFTHAGVLSVTGGTLDINGNYTSSGNVVANITGGSIEIAGNWDGTSGSGFDPSGGTVFFNGGTQAISTHTSNYFHNVTIGGTTNTKSARSNLDINGNLSISSATLDMYASEDNTIDLEGDFTISSSGTFTAQGGSHDVAGAWDDANGTFQASEGTVTLSGISKNITTGNSNYFFNLEINSTGTKTATTNLDINGVFTLTAGTFDAGSTNIDIVGDWDDSGNNGGFTPSAGTVTLSGAGSNITTGSNNNFFNLIINTSGAKSVQSELDINGDLTVNDGELAMGGNNADVASGKTVTIASSKTLSISSGVFTANGTSDINGVLSITSTGKYDADGDFDATGGTITFGGAGFLEMSGSTTNLGSSFTEGSGTVEYDGTSSQTIFNTTYNNLIIDQNSTKTASANLDVDGNLTIDNSATLDMSASNYNLTLDGNYTLTSGTFTSRTGTVTFNGGGAQTLTPGSSSFYNLTTATNSTNVTLQADITVTNDLTIASSTTLDAGSNRGIILGGNFANNGTFTDQQGTVTFNGSGTLTSNASELYNITTSGTGTITIGDALTIANDLTIGSGTTFDVSASNYAIGISGDFANSGTFTDRSGTVTFNGTGTLTSNASELYNVTTNGTGTVTLGDALTVANDLTIGSGTTFDVSASNYAIGISGDFANSGTFTDRSGTVTFNGTGTLTSNGSELYNITSNGTGTITLGDALTIANDLTIGSNTTLDVSGSNYAIGIKGNFANSGTFTDRSGTVTFNGNTAQSLTSNSSELYNVTTSGTGTVSLGDALTVANDLTIGSGTTFDVSGSNYAIGIKGNFANSGTFTDRSGTVTFSGNTAQSLTSNSSELYNITTSGTGTVTLGDALTVSNDLTIGSGTTFDVSVSNYAIGISGDFANSGTFTDRSGTVTFNGTGTLTSNGSELYNITTNGTGTVTLGDALTIANDLTIGANTTLDVSGTNFGIDIKGNWSNSGTFTDRNGTVTFNGGDAQSITSGGSNFFNLTTATSSTAITISDNTTVDGNLTVVTNTTLVTGSNDVTVEQLLTIGGESTVNPGGKFVLENANITGTLTVDADGSNNATLDFSTATGTTDFSITGTLNLDGHDANRRAVVSGDADSRIDFDISSSGILNADYFTMSYPTAAGFKISSSGTQVISYGNFDGPSGSSGVLLDLSGTGTLSSAEVTGCNFENTGAGGGTNGINIKSDASTQVITLTSYGGTLASSASVAEANDDDDDNKIFFFNNEYYSHNNNNPNTAGNWYSATNGTGINPSDFTNGSHKFIVQSGDTYTATGSWSVAGEIQVIGTLDVNSRTVTMTGATDLDGTLIISSGTYNADGASDIAGTLSITGTGVYDADNTFTAASGAVTFTGAGFLKCSNTVTDLGTLSTGAGTVQYDGGAQNVLADDYYNLVVDQSGNKTAQGAINIANDMTISNSASFLTSTNTIDVSGATTVSATLEIGNALYNSRGGFSATGNINFSHSGGKLRFYTVSPTSLGTLDNTDGTVVYMSGATDVLSDNYYTLTIDDGGTAKTLQGNANIAGNLNVKSSNELNLGDNTLTVTGNSDIDGVLDFNNGGTLDANNTFDATGGTVQFTGSGGTLKLGGATVTSLGNTLTEGTGTIEYDYAGNQTVLSETYYNLTINNSTGTKTAGGALDIDGDLTVTAGELAMTSSNADVATGKTVNIDGTLSITTGTFTANGSTSDIDGTLTINGAGIYDADGTFDGTNGTIQFTGSGGTLKLGGATVSSIGSGFVHGTGTVEYDYAGNQSVKARNYYNLEIDGTNTSHVKDVINSFTVDNNLTVSSTSTFDVLNKTITVTGASDIDGILNINGSGILDANGAFDATSASITMDGTARLQLNSTVTSLGTLDDAAGTVEYGQAGNQTILSAHTYYDLEIDGSGSKRTDGNTTANDVSITAAGTLDINFGSDDLTIKGDFSNSGALSASNRKITFSGSTQNTSALINDNTVDLVVDKSSTGGITFGGNSSFDEVTVTDGYLDIGAYTFAANNTISIPSDGTLRIPNNGTFDADGQLTTSGEIDFTGSGSQGDLICSSTSANTFGTMDAAAGTVTFDGSSSQAIPAETFFNLKNSNSNGLTMSGDATVNGELNLNVAANIITGANTLTIGAGGSIANAADDRHINVDNTSGFLAKSTNSTSAFSFPVGNGTILRPIRLTPSSSSAETYTVRFDDNRYSDGTVTTAFSDNGGHISGYDGSNTDVTKGYHYDITRSNSVNAVLYIAWTDDDQYGTNGNVLNADVTGITFGYYNASNKWDVITSSPSGSPSSGNVTSNAFNFAGRYVTLGSLDGENNLPIDLVSFDGECIDNQVNLEFIIASQVNNDYFTIKRSKNILEWEEVGYIDGGGTNNEEITYTWKDYSPKSGVNYYKLFQTDVDGISESFAPIAVTCESKVEDYHIYPNPTSNRIAVEFELEFYQGDDIKLVLRDFKGSIVKSNSIELNRGYNYFEVDLNDIPNGIYTVGYLGTKNHIPLKRVIKL